MNDLALIIAYALLSGFTIFLGGILSHYFGDHVKSGHIKVEIILLSIAFGGGILLAAVGLVLVPEGMKALPLASTLACFSLGTITFFLLDQYIQKHGGTMAQLIDMVSDYIPESIAMGAVLTQNSSLGLLLALIIGIQNLPESFNAYMDLKTKYSTRKSILILLFLSCFGIMSALVGYYFLADMPEAVGALMVFSAGGIIYLIFQDIVPMSKLKKNWIPALGASLDL